MSLPYAERFLQHLGKFLRYEIAIGCNKCLWVTSSSAAEVFLVKSALGECRWFSPGLVVYSRWNHGGLWSHILKAACAWFIDWNCWFGEPTHVCAPIHLHSYFSWWKPLAQPFRNHVVWKLLANKTLNKLLELLWNYRLRNECRELYTGGRPLHQKKRFLPDAFHHIDASDIVCCDTSTNSLREVPVKYVVEL